MAAWPPCSSTRLALQWVPTVACDWISTKVALVEDGGERGGQNASVDVCSRCRATEQGSKPQLIASSITLPRSTALPIPLFLSLSFPFSLPNFQLRLHFDRRSIQHMINAGIPSRFSQGSAAKTALEPAMSRMVQRAVGVQPCSSSRRLVL